MVNGLKRSSESSPPKPATSHYIGPCIWSKLGRNDIEGKKNIMKKMIKWNSKPHIYQMHVDSYTVMRRVIRSGQSNSTSSDTRVVLNVTQVLLSNASEYP